MWNAIAHKFPTGSLASTAMPHAATPHMPSQLGVRCYSSDDSSDEEEIEYEHSYIQIPHVVNESLQRSQIVIDGTAPDFSCTAVVGNEITECVPPLNTLY